MNFKSHLQEVWCDGFFCHGLRFMMMKKICEADSPLEIQINFAHRHSKSFSKPITLSENAWNSCQKTLRDGGKEA